MAKINVGRRITLRDLQKAGLTVTPGKMYVRKEWLPKRRLSLQTLPTLTPQSSRDRLHSMDIQLEPNQFLVDKRGKPQAVVLSLVDYRKLVHFIEDAADTKALKRAIRTSRRTISHDALLQRLKQQRLL